MTKTESRRKYLRKWRHTPKGQAASWRYDHSPQGLKYRNEKRWRHYGLVGATVEQYQALLSHQGNVCVICKKSPKNNGLAWDHDWKTGHPRGLLCQKCNQLVAYIENGLADRAMAYLASYTQ